MRRLRGSKLWKLESRNQSKNGSNSARQRRQNKPKRKQVDVVIILKLNINYGERTSKISHGKLEIKEHQDV